MEINVTTSDLMSVQQAAAQLGKPRVTVYRRVKAGKLLSIKLGGIIYIPKSEVERLLEYFLKEMFL
ncbi:hypothetical protein LCGC14_1342700 [marine sediment metagenome]|uniref:Helix-turn-helix domain-containing protein n=1 Tax=marine sediment metagenome TaxID=412755 RepID=A0A0F9KDX2_9ZZZZ